MLEGITPLHLILVLVIAMVVIGPGKLPEVGSAIGKTIREFRKATSDAHDAVQLDPVAPTAAASVPAPTPLAAGTPPRDSTPGDPVAAQPAHAPAAPGGTLR